MGFHFCMSSRVVLITGCSTGVGKALALQLANMGDKYKVYATMRNPKEISETPKDNLIVSRLDVTCDDSVETLMKDIPRVDILVNNAGYAINGTHESNTMEQVKQQFDTNFFGVVRMHRAVLPLMRAQKSGHIIGISSVGGLIGVPFNDIYCASKFALEGLYESMASTNLQLGIQTSLVEPGAIKTAFVANVDAPDPKDLPEEMKPVFDQYKQVMTATFESGSAQTADDVAAVIIRAIDDGENNKASLRYQTSSYAETIAKAKVVDPTGNSLVQGSSARFFPSNKN